MKIGITLNLSINFWSNGLNQNVKFIYDIFKRLGHEVYYITNNSPSSKFNFSHKFMMQNDVLLDSNESFDCIIMAGFEMSSSNIKLIKKRNAKCKFILLQLGNKLMFDLKDSINPPENKEVKLNHKSQGSLLSSIWVSPHHAFGSEYVKVAYGNDNVKIAPYVWDPFFVQGKIEDLKSKGLSPFFNPKLVKKIGIFESNSLINKSFLIPLCIAEKSFKECPDLIEGVSLFCMNNFKNNNFFKVWMNTFNITQKDSLVFFNNRWSSLDALSKFCGTIVSHQYDNDLNYAHFEALYMGLPLIHNSKTLMDEGYYYPDFDIGIAANQLHNAINNHHKFHDDYMRSGRDFVAKYSPYNDSILHKYQLLLENK